MNVFFIILCIYILCFYIEYCTSYFTWLTPYLKTEEIIDTTWENENQNTIHSQIIERERDLLRKALSSKLDLASEKETALQSQNQQLQTRIEQLEKCLETVAKEKLDAEASLAMAASTNKGLLESKTKQEKLIESLNSQLNLATSGAFFGRNEDAALLFGTQGSSVVDSLHASFASPTSNSKFSTPQKSPLLHSKSKVPEDQRVISSLFNRCRDLESSLYQSETNLRMIFQSELMEMKAEEEALVSSLRENIESKEAKIKELNQSIEQQRQMHAEELDNLSRRLESLLIVSVDAHRKEIESVESRRALQYRHLSSKLENMEYLLGKFQSGEL